MKLCLIVLLATGICASAHPVLQNSMWVVFAPERVRVAVNVTLREIMVAQQTDEAALDAASQKHGAYVLEHLALRAGTNELKGRVANVTPPILFGDPEQTFYQYELDYPLPSGAPPENVSFTHTMLREWPYSPGHAWDISYLVRLKRSDQPDVNSALLHAGESREFPTGWTEPKRVQAGAASPRRNWRWWLLAAALVLACGVLVARVRYWK